MGKDTAQIIRELAAPFPARNIHFRIGSTNKRAEERRTGNKNARPTKGIALAYIDARDAMERLDAVVGPENWQRRYPWSDGGRLYCEVGIRLGGEWIWKGDGAGDTQVEAEKGAFSDAFKRACVNWGLAQYLYDMPNAWLELNEYGNAFKEPEQVRSRFEAWQTKYFEKRGQS